MTIKTVDWPEEVANNYQNQDWFDAFTEDIHDTRHRLTPRDHFNPDQDEITPDHYRTPLIVDARCGYR